MIDVGNYTIVFTLPRVFSDARPHWTADLVRPNITLNVPQHISIPRYSEINQNKYNSFLRSEQSQATPVEYTANDDVMQPLCHGHLHISRFEPAFHFVNIKRYIVQVYLLHHVVSIQIYYTDLFISITL